MNAKSLLMITLGAISSAAISQFQPSAEMQPGNQSEPSRNQHQTFADPDSQDRAIPYSEQPASSGNESVRPAPQISTPFPASGGSASSSSGAGVDSPMPHKGVSAHSATRSRPMGPPAQMTSVVPITENGITHLCGGIGSDEAAEMKRAARGYDLMLTFATRGGSYLADVNVEITAAQGPPLVKVTCDAPIMLLAMPKAGTYRIRAETGGFTLNRKIAVQRSTKGKRLEMVWPEPVVRVETNNKP